MLRALRSRRMLAGVTLAVAFAVVCILLGRWQWGRYEDRLVRAEAVTTHHAAPPVPLASVASRIPLTEEDQWLRVSTTGRYATGQQLLVRNRSFDGSPGLEVLVPLDLDGDPPGRRLFVDRGWVPSADSASELPPVPPPPGGDVTVRGWLRSGEPDLGRDLPQGQLASIDIATAGAQTGTASGRALDAYLVLESETPAASPRPAALAPPDTDLGPHQAYAFQWWLTSVFGFVLVGFRLRVAGAQEGGHARVPAATRPQKVRIWDEEDA